MLKLSIIIRGESKHSAAIKQAGWEKKKQAGQSSETTFALADWHQLLVHASWSAARPSAATAQAHAVAFTAPTLLTITPLTRSISDSA